MSDLNILKMLADRIEHAARALAWESYYKNHDRERWDAVETMFPDYYEPDEYREKVVETLFQGAMLGALNGVK
jgi:hypothetical protein